MNHITHGIITKKYAYALDGEFSSGTITYNVSVTQTWKTGTLKHTPKEVITDDNTCFRMSKTHGWRQYNKSLKQFQNSIATYYFTPNKTTNHLHDFTKTNLGSF